MREYHAEGYDLLFETSTAALSLLRNSGEAGELDVPLGSASLLQRYLFELGDVVGDYPPGAAD